VIKVAGDIELDPEQIAAYEKLVAETGGIIWMRVGEGKTRPALLAASEIASRRCAPVILVIARRAAFYDWTTEVATLQLGVDVIEYEHWDYKPFNCQTVMLVSEGKVYTDLTHDMIRFLHQNKAIGCIILDEGWLYKNPQSQKHKAVRRWTELHPGILLSGSIMTARDIVDIYGQVTAMGRGRKLAPNLTKFRQEFQIGVQNPGGPNGSYPSWHPKPGAYQRIMDKIAPFTHIYIPDVSRVKTKVEIIKVPPTAHQLRYIKELKETAAIEGKFELSNVANIITKAQQISDGWLKGEGGTDWFESGKIPRLELLLEEIMMTEFKVVVWCAFREDIKRLMESALKFSKEVATLQSREKFDVVQWNRDDCRICLATEASGSSVNHFAQVPYAIYYSQDTKWHSLQQSSGRHTRRSSQHDTAYNIFLHTDKSLDAQVYYTVRQSRHSEKSFILRAAVQSWIEERGKTRGAK
jgi:hypothetical protein